MEIAPPHLAGRMLDLDSLIAFVRAAQQELVWIHERETIEVARNWSDIHQLDLPMLQNYYKQVIFQFWTGNSNPLRGSTVIQCFVEHYKDQGHTLNDLPLSNLKNV